MSYRYELSRQWNMQLPTVHFVMLNPSTADETRDDPTIRKCVGFAKLFGFGSLYVLNLFAYRSTNPSGLYAADDPIGPLNDDYVRQAVALANPLTEKFVVAWGANARSHQGRVHRMRELLPIKNTYALGFTKEGYPKHPLYVPYSAQLQEYQL